MAKLDLLSDRRLLRGEPHRVHALTISFVFHGLFIVALIVLGYLYHPALFIVPKGSAPGGPVITLETMVIVAPPSEPAPPAPIAPPLPATPPLPVKVAIVTAGVPTPPRPQQIVSRTQPTDAGVPVLAGPVTKPVPATPAKSGTPVPKVASSAATGTGTGHLRPASAKFVSSYTPGTSVFPHPPYPPEARDLQQTGIVRMMIRFDNKGDVAQAEVAQSSGVAVLDSETREYIREHWHSQAYAGQAVSVPVEYTLTSL